MAGLFLNYHDGLSTGSPVSPTEISFLQNDEPSQELSEDNDETEDPETYPIMSGTMSSDGDRNANASTLLTSSLADVRPQPAYVASSGASQIVGEHQSREKRVATDSEEDGDDEIEREDVSFTDPALALVNVFLDQLLYSFLFAARSNSLRALRPAVSAVLRHRLGREAIASADEELIQLTAGEDEDDVDVRKEVVDGSRNWDLELMWKRTRLRVMVYTRLGEVEDDDEQRYVAEEKLYSTGEHAYSSFSRSAGLVSWATAIFLTSVLEFVAEKTLQVAGQAAYIRARRLSRNQRLNPDPQYKKQDGLLVEAQDVEKVGLDPALGKLWRSWKRTTRSNGTSPSTSRPGSSSLATATGERAVSGTSANHSQKSSISTVRGGDIPDIASLDARGDGAYAQHPEQILASSISISMFESSRDINEIEVPGLAGDPDDEGYVQDTSNVPYPDDIVGMHVPLPLGDPRRDVDEIEVPGLARDPDVVEEDQTSASARRQTRRNSFGHSGLYLATSRYMSVSEVATSDRTSVAPTVRQRSMSTGYDPSLPMAEEVAPAVLPFKRYYAVPTAPFASAHQAESTAPDRAVDDESTVPHRSTAKSQLNVKNPLKNDGTGATVDGKSHDNLTQTPEIAYPWINASAVAGTSAANKAWRASARRDVSNMSTHPRDEYEIPSENVDSSGVLSDVHKDGAVSSRTERDVEELDKRKSLLDIKSLLGVSNHPTPASGGVSPAKSSELSSLSDTDSEDGDKLVPRDASDISSQIETNMPVSGLTETRAEHVDGASALSATSPPADGVVDSSDARLRESNTIIDPTSQQQSTLAKYSDTIKPTGPGPVPTSSTMPLVTAHDNVPSYMRYKPATTTDVQEDQASREIPEETSTEPITASKSDATPTLTSAAIRGPEDFDMFVQDPDVVQEAKATEPVQVDPTASSSRSADAAKAPAETTAVPVPRTALDDTLEALTGKKEPVAPVQSTPNATVKDRASKRQSVARPPTTNSIAHRRSGYLAREPRVVTESTRDFADFIRSTGPGEERAVTPLMRNVSASSLRSLRAAHINGASASRAGSRSSSPGATDRTRSTTVTSADDENVPPVPPIPTRAKSTMQPREAKTNVNGSSDLIDFIRSGPDQAGTHRIPRTVAPFRTTMDSDQFHDLAADSNMDQANNRLSNNDGGTNGTRSIASPSPASYDTSANSRSALLSDSGKRTYAFYSDQQSPAKPSLPSGTLEDTRSPTKDPTRKRYRNKDPYAIDLSDEDEDDDDDETENSTIRQSQNHRQEESWIDFLNAHDPGPTKPTHSNPNVHAPNGTGTLPRITTATPPFRQTQNSALGPTSISASPSASAVARSKMVPRSGKQQHSQDSNTRDLADFLRSSGPEEEEKEQTMMERERDSAAPAPVVGTKSSAKGAGVAAGRKRKGLFGRGR